MPDVSFENLLAVVAVALLVPLLLGLAPRLRVPSVVLEILAGVALGPGGLGLVHPDLSVRVLAVVGLAFLLFLAGLEIDVRALRGRPLALATGGYLLTLAAGAAVGLLLGAVGWVDSPLLLAVTLSATSLGLVVPVLKDAGVAGSATGGVVVAAASVADFAAVLLLSLPFSADAGSGGSRSRTASGSSCSPPSPSSRWWPSVRSDAASVRLGCRTPCNGCRTAARRSGCAPPWSRWSASSS